MRRTFLAILAAVAGLLSSPAGLGVLQAEDAAIAEAPPRKIELTDPLPYGAAPVDYLSSSTDDPVRPVARKLADGSLKLDWKPPHGYLESLLKALDVPVESQLLVFSKTALNPGLVSPRNPRAIYFNDDVSVGWVPGSEAIELTATDPVKGAIFYTLRQSQRTPTLFRREERCQACHVGTTTLSVPGLMVRSFVPDELGKPLAGYSRITHETPIAHRLGGWYVTGTHGDQPHAGNLYGADAPERYRDHPLAAGNRTELEPRVAAKYLTPHSDLVAHLVLQHQAHGLNLITRVGYEARFDRRSDAESLLVRYLLFADEAATSAPMAGTSGFYKAFAARGSARASSRSLRAFDLKTRLFERRLSYLIEGRAFRGLPTEARERVSRSIEAALREETGGPAAHIPRKEREELVAILRESAGFGPP